MSRVDCDLSSDDWRAGLERIGQVLEREAERHAERRSTVYPVQETTPKVEPPTSPRPLGLRRWFGWRK